jgi:hypothetical protein
VISHDEIHAAYVRQNMAREVAIGTPGFDFQVEDADDGALDGYFEALGFDPEGIAKAGLGYGSAQAMGAVQEALDVASQMPGGLSPENVAEALLRPDNLAAWIAAGFVSGITVGAELAREDS